MARHNKREREHPGAVESFNHIRNGDTPYRKLYTSDYVLDEAVTGCRRRTRNHRLSVELGTAILSSESIVLLKVDDNALEESWELYKERSEVNLSFTDCTTSILARRHGITDLYTYDDKDFQPLGFHTISSI